MPSNPKDWQPLGRTAASYAAQVEHWLNEVYPASGGPLLLAPPPPDEQAIWESGEAIARRMVAAVSRTNATLWRAAVARGTSLSTSRRIFAALQTEMAGPTGVRVRELIERNTKLMAALPDEVNRRTLAYVAEQQRRGVRSAVLVPELEKRLPQLRKSAVRMMARGGVAQAETALMRTRSESLGLRWYDWATSEDQRVRPSHRKMDKVLVAWDDAPSPEALAGEKSYGHYHPGGTRWCRCIALPLIDLAEVTWPHKVYAHGATERMGRADFSRFSGLPQAA